MCAAAALPATQRLAEFVAALRYTDLPAPLQTQMSVPFAVAMALTLAPGRGWPPVLTLDDFERSLSNPRVRDLSRRTVCVRDPEIEQASTTEYVPARVVVRLASGGRRERAVWLPPGTDLESWLEQARSPELLTGVSQLMSLRGARGCTGANEAA